MKKIDRVIQTIREMMVANAPGSQGGMSASAPAEGPVAGFDPLMKFMSRKKKVDYRKVPNTYKKWVNSLENK